LNEEVIRTSLSGAISYYEENEPRGEYVLVIEGATNEDLSKDSFFANMTLTEHLDYYISQGMSKMDATKAVAKDRGVGKSAIYNELNK
jgi:16S rRNA (cytidine1402-2'-O)-methyltransferase